MTLPADSKSKGDSALLNKDSSARKLLGNVAKLKEISENDESMV